MNNISVLILTKNEQQDLPGCLASVAWSDDIHVYDSMSTDKTVEIAEAFGAKVTERPFDNWAAHQNWGLQNITFNHPWVFYIDSDERMTPELVAALQQAVQNAGDICRLPCPAARFFYEHMVQACSGIAFLHAPFSPGENALRTSG